jgi:hypothetical protein
MTLIMIRGDVGSGKTLLATMWAMEDQRTIRANYHIKKKGFVLLEPEDLHNLDSATLAIIDEAWAWLESRLSGKPINLFLSYILFQSRKKQLDLILTTQLGEVIDKRFRQMSNFIIDCEQIPEGFLYQITPRGKRPHTVFLALEDAEKIYPCYDTMEQIDPIDEELIYKVSNKQKLLPKQDAIIAKMFKIAPAKEWTAGAVEAYFLEEHLAHAEYRSVFQRIKLSILKGESQEELLTDVRSHKKKVIT